MYVRVVRFYFSPALGAFPLDVCALFIILKISRLRAAEETHIFFSANRTRDFFVFVIVPDHNIAYPRADHTMVTRKISAASLSRLFYDMPMTKT